MSEVKVVFNKKYKLILKISEIIMIIYTSFLGFPQVPPLIQRKIRCQPQDKLLAYN